MNEEKVTSELFNHISHVSRTIGTGSPAVDVALIAAVMCSFAVVVALYVWWQARKTYLESNTGELRTMPGRVSKLERNLNDFRTEIMRSVEAFKADAGLIKRELGDIREAVQARGGSGSGGSQGSGGSGQGPWEDEDAEDEQERFGSPDDNYTGGREEIEVEAPLAERLQRTRQGLFGRIKSLLSGRVSIDGELLEELQAILVSSDIGVKLADALIEQVKQDIAAGVSIGQKELVTQLKAKILAILGDAAKPDEPPKRRNDGPVVYMIVGVNGVGKTTTLAKLAAVFSSGGSKVMLVAADTFRAAAVEQLQEWGRRLNVAVISGREGAKPATVVFDAMTEAVRGDFDVVLIDTAGRLHTKSNLMQELSGVRSAIQRHQDSAPHEVLLVIDGATGQNALVQAREFNAAVPLTGLVVTKLDGTPKGGIVVAVQDELSVPVRYIGVGEGARDLRPFDSAAFVEALFSERPDEAASGKLSAHAEARKQRRDALGALDLEGSVA